MFVRYCDGASFSGDAEGRAQVKFSESWSDVAVFVASSNVLFHDDVGWKHTSLQGIAHLPSGY